MKILVIDGQGGGIGKEIIERLKDKDLMIYAVGTNNQATKAMLAAGANRAATGENAVKVLSKEVDIIIGPIGILVTDSFLGEVTPKIVKAVGRSKAKKILIPFNDCNTFIVGVNDEPVRTVIDRIEAMILSEM